jgi:hypothetical protein
MKKMLISMAITLCAFSYAQASQISCDVELLNDGSFTIELNNDSTSNPNVYQMMSPRIGLYGRCQKMESDLFCTTNKGEIIEINSSGSFEWQKVDGQRLNGISSCN